MSVPLFATKDIGSISTRALEEVLVLAAPRFQLGTAGEGLGVCLHTRFSSAPWGEFAPYTAQWDFRKKFLPVRMVRP